MFVTNWISTTKIQKISEITNFFRHYFLSRTEVNYEMYLLILYENRSFMEKNGCRMQYYPLFLVIMIYKLLWK